MLAWRPRSLTEFFGLRICRQLRSFPLSSVLACPQPLKIVDSCAVFPLPSVLACFQPLKKCRQIRSFPTFPCLGPPPTLENCRPLRIFTTFCVAVDLSRLSTAARFRSVYKLPALRKWPILGRVANPGRWPTTWASLGPT